MTTGCTTSSSNARARELRELVKVELDVRHDVFVGQSNRPGSARIAGLIQRQEYISRIEAYLMERKRRETASKGERMEALSRSLNRLTVIIAVATIIGVGRRFQRVEEFERGDDLATVARRDQAPPRASFLTLIQLEKSANHRLFRSCGFPTSCSQKHRSMNLRCISGFLQCPFTGLDQLLWPRTRRSCAGSPGRSRS